MTPTLGLITFLLNISTSYGDDGRCVAPPIDDFSINVRYIFTPIWETTILERMGAWEWNTTTPDRDYMNFFQTTRLPWDTISKDTVYINMRCGQNYVNHTAFRRTIGDGVLRNYTKVYYVAICLCRVPFLNKDILHGLTRLSFLFLLEAGLHTIHEGTLTALPSLVRLRLNSNNLSNFDSNQFCSTPNIKFVELRKSHVHQFKLGNVTASGKGKSCQWVRFNSVVLADNRHSQLTDESFQNMNLNGILNLEYCSIASIRASYFKNLDSLLDLDLSYNLISALPSNVFSSKKYLQAIQLSHNRIQHVDVHDAFAENPLRAISLNNNEIYNITGSFSEITTLTEIDLHNNYISLISNSIFKGMLWLKKIDMSNNLITTIEHGTFLKCPLLQRLNLGNNRIDTINNSAISDLISLEHLDLGSNNIYFFEDSMFDKLPNLKSVDLHENKIRGKLTINLVSFVIELVELSFNTITGLNILNIGRGQCPQPGSINTTLLASNNKINDIYVNCPVMWTTLDLTNNKITDLKQFAKFTNTRNLYLRGNIITHIACGSLIFGRDNLIVLDLGNNNIGYICKGSFDGHFRLTSLSLENNHLTHLYRNRD